MSQVRDFAVSRNESTGRYEVVSQGGESHDDVTARYYGLVRFNLERTLARAIAAELNGEA